MNADAAGRCRAARLAHAAAGCLVFALILGAAIYVRGAGLWRGLGSPAYSFHPDEARQVLALRRFLAGTYVLHTGNLFYDGYAHGLNRVDEWLLRAALPPARAAGAWTGGGAPPDRSIPDRVRLTAWARGLRLLYSVAAWAGFVLLLRAMGMPRGVQRLGAAWLALAPLPVSAMHAATGDVGVELFGVLLLLALHRHAAGGRLRWWLAAGAAVGMAFACKYQGLLLGLNMALFCAMCAPRGVGAAFAFVLRRGATALAAAAAGAVALNPALVLDFRTAALDMWRNLVFVREYRADESFLQLPFAAQAVRSLGANTGRVALGLGVATVLLAVAGALWSARAARAGRDGVGDPRARARAFEAACAAGTFAALLLSLAGKPAVELLHFSWLQAPLALAAAVAVTAARKWRGPALASALGLLPLAEGAVRCGRESYFWSRTDSQLERENLPVLLFEPEYRAAHRRPQVAKSLALEHSDIAPFRNRWTVARWPEGRVWASMGVVPAPSAPLPLDSSWIFANGPVLPNNDRQVALPAYGAVSRVVVSPEPAPGLRLGIRCGPEPTDVSLGAGGRRERVFLRPHEWRVVALDSRGVRRGAGDGPVTRFTELAMRSGSGPAVVEVLDAPEAEEAFRLWSGGDLPADRLRAWAGRMRGAAEMVSRLRFVECAGDAAGAAAGSRAPATALSTAPLWIPAGRYRFQMDIEAAAGRAAAGEVWVGGADAQGPAGCRRAFSVTNGGCARVEFPVVKPLEPYGGALWMRCLHGAVRVRSWRLRADLDGMAADLDLWAETGARPPWAGAAQ